MTESLQRSRHHHVQRHLGLTDPAHAVRQAGRAQPVLPQQVTLALTAEHVGVGNPQIAQVDLAVVVATRHGLDVSNNFPPRTRQVDNEAGVGGLGNFWVFLGSSDQQRELRAPRPGNEPLVPVDDPLVTVAVREGSNQCRI